MYEIEITIVDLDADAYVYVCAVEWETCYCDGEVRYGAEEGWTDWVEVNRSIECTNEVFGDPVSGVFKSCECTNVELEVDCRIPIGRSDSVKLKTDTEHGCDYCSNEPLNDQEPEWSDAFEVEVSGTVVVVTRTDFDTNTGWGQGSNAALTPLANNMVRFT